MEDFTRYRILIITMIIQLCVGIIYMWSVFRDPVAIHLNWDAGAASLTSAVMLSMVVLGTLFGGLAQDKLGPRMVMLAGSVIFGVGIIVTAFASADFPWLVYVTYGGIAGFGAGTAYATSLATVQKWFPDRRGFATGMTTCAIGSSLIIFAPLGNFLLNRFGVSLTFIIIGVGFMIVCCICSLSIQNPPQGFLPVGFVPNQIEEQRKQYTPSEIIKTRQFYLLGGALLFTMPAYFILNPVFKSLGTIRGLSDELALFGVMLTGVSNAAGRLTVSWLSDKIGRKAAMAAIAVIILIASLLMISAEGIMFLICIMLVAYGFGGGAGLYPAMTTESFGTKHGGINFGLVMIGFCISSLLFPIISVKLTELSGSYTNSFLLAAATCVIAIVLVSLIKDPNKDSIV